MARGELRSLAPEVRLLVPEVRLLASEVRLLEPEVRSLAPEVRSLAPEVRQLPNETRRNPPEIRMPSNEVFVAWANLYSTSPRLAALWFEAFCSGGRARRQSAISLHSPKRCVLLSLNLRICRKIEELNPRVLFLEIFQGPFARKEDDGAVVGIIGQPAARRQL